MVLIRFLFIIFWMMFLEVMMTQFKKSTICKINYWSNKYMEGTESPKKRKKEKNFNIKQAALAC